MPCSDGDTCADETKADTSLVISGHDHSTDEADFCSPFCVCSCCSVQITQPSYFHFVVFNPAYTGEPATPLKHLFQSVDLSIWQPPRIS
ncbi:hypothetical protein KK078_00275 [Fulvivirgaceae bacterium PWU37]|uniref:Uncharacterized protein n=2 Tax=Dawidia soli TaxID=2782352 RepID=A0AAP2GBC3_9BACT|nr:hypothetical protein [Dawidia soli]